MTESYSKHGIQVIDLSPIKSDRPGVYSIYDLLDKFRHRAALYVGPHGVKGLHTFIMAYELAMEHAGFKSVEEPKFHRFDEFVRQAYGFSSQSVSWSMLILGAVIGCDKENTSWDDYDRNVTPQQFADSLSEFNRLLDEFRREPAGEN